MFEPDFLPDPEHAGFFPDSGRPHISYFNVDAISDENILEGLADWGYNGHKSELEHELVVQLGKHKRKTRFKRNARINP
jgi:hypothetical protein